ncbi:unnamed protein product [Phytomonas sp. Hart1]|nr:unnamed protein product [Phytomonas sp. Hart1]|eukprot:CCW69489.1 unnamed protein product [Phytomonas sp. isolate Hart1]
MFRSMGEFTDYAKALFAVFSSPSVPSNAPDKMTCTSAAAPASQRYLEKKACMESFYVLFGYEPTPSLFSGLFTHEDIAPTTAELNGRIIGGIDERTFLTFMQTCAEHEEGLLMGNLNSTITCSGKVSPSVSVASAWKCFKALAADKDYITLDDFILADREDPFSGVGIGINQQLLEQDAERDADNSMLAPFHATLRGRRHALLSHVFTILDTNGDGRIPFADFKDALISLHAV